VRTCVAAAVPRVAGRHPELSQQELQTELLPGGVRYDVDGQIARVTLARPFKRNAQTPDTWLRLAEIGAEMPADVRVVVVAGEGPSFSAGLDRSMFGTLPNQLSEGDDSFLALIASYQAGFSWLRDPQFVSIAAIQGHAVGAGFQLALACDLRIAAEDAQFTMAEPALGLVPDLGGTQVLVDLVGYARALEICATGRRVGAGEAAGIGLANLVVPADHLAASVDDLAAAICGSPAAAVTATKALLLGARDRSYADQLLAERTAQMGRIKSLAEEMSRGSGAQP
jgi:enoyl-CoA hydratase/carnithine racemase